MDTPRVLFVDDEISAINSLRRELRLHCRDWQLEFCQSPTEALKRLSEFDPWVIVSDKRMLEMDGAEFLRSVSKQSPEVIRVMLTGDTSSVVALEVADIAHVLIAKPFELETLVQLLHRAKCLRTIPVSLSVRKQLGAIEQIPVLPQVYQQLSEYLKKDDADIKQIGRIISRDSIILAKLLQLANSAFFGFSSHVTNPHDAVIRLGIKLIKNLVLIFGVFKQCQTVDDKTRDQLFAQAMDVAEISRQLSAVYGCGRVEANNAFVLGLLHNVGLLVSRMSIIELEKVDKACEQGPDAIVGAYLLTLWEFEDEFINAMLYQNSPERAGQASALLSRLHVAKVVSKAKKQGISALDERAGLNQPMLRSQGLLDDLIPWLKAFES